MGNFKTGNFKQKNKKFKGAKKRDQFILAEQKDTK